MRSEQSGGPHLRQRYSVISRNMEQGTVAMDIHTGRCFQLGQVASFMWGLIQKEPTLEEILEKVAQNFHLSRELAEKAVKVLLEDLEGKGLIEKT
jgi:hypothetical protein